MSPDKDLRSHLLELLDGGSAHLKPSQVLKSFPAEARAAKAAGVPYSPWQLLEHMRIAQWDILEFSRDPNHVSPPYPEGYWPASEAPASQEEWGSSVEAFQAGLEEVKQLVSDPAVDLLATIPHGDGQTVLREAMLVADHNAYHLGQLVLLRRLLGDWAQS